MTDETLEPDMDLLKHLTPQAREDYLRETVKRSTLRDGIPVWDTFIKQVAELAVKTYGSQYNKWALMIPAVISELTSTIGAYVHENILEDEIADVQGQTDFLGELENIDEVKMTPEEVAAIDARMNKLAPGARISLDPFRPLEEETGIEEEDLDLF